MDRTRKWLAVLAALVVVNLALAGLLYVRLNTRLPDPMAEKPGFTAATVHAPLLPSGDPRNWDARPDATTRFPPGYSMQARWSADLAYAGWGGTLRGWIKNTGQNDLFVYGIAIDGDWGAAACETVGILIKPGEERYLGLLAFPGPDAPGNYSYMFKTGLLARKTSPVEEGLPLDRWWDYGYVGNAMKPLEFRPPGERQKVRERTNPAYYFDKANRLMDSRDSAVLQRAGEIRALFPGDYSIYQAAAAFDFVHDYITYKAEPPGEDDWQSPAETLNLLTGDCEDYTLLLAALVTAMGGTTRFHVETDHAFLSVFAGTDLQAATDALSRYYNTGLRVASFSDRYGCWVMADATDSDFLGALPLGGEPLAAGGWGLTNTTVHYPVDLLPD